MAKKQSKPTEKASKPSKTVWRFTANLPDIGYVLEGERVTADNLKALENNNLKAATYTLDMT